MSSRKLGRLVKRIANGYRGAGVVYVCGGEVLMQLRAHPPVWSFVGGGFDPDKDRDFIDTAVREFREETGISISRDDIQPKPLHRLGFWRYQWRLYLVVSDTKPDTSHAPAEYRFEWRKYRWFDISNYRAQLLTEERNETFFFVKYQMKKLSKHLGIH